MPLCHTKARKTPKTWREMTSMSCRATIHALNVLWGDNNKQKTIAESATGIYRVSWICQWYQKYLQVAKPDSPGYDFATKSVDHIKAELFMEQ